MNASDKKKTAIFAGLLLIAGARAYYVLAPASTPDPAAPAKVAGKVAPQKISQDGEIQLGLVGKISTEVGNKNLFQYYQRPAPKPVEPPRTSFASLPQPQFQPVPTPQPIVQAPPPFRAFRYDGFSGVKGGGKILGSISEGGNTYEVREGDCVMGQYCVTRLTEGLVELEDLQSKQRRSFTRTP